MHGYERWAPAFGAYAPPLLGVHEDEPLALLLGELPGAILETVQLPADRERAAWRTAGRMLAGLHAAAGQPADVEGAVFGPCGRDGLPTGAPIGDAVEYVES